MGTRTRPELKIIGVQQALEAAREIIKTEGLRELRDCELLNNPKVAAQTPFPVRQERGDAAVRQSTYSYIVPYGIEGDHDKDGTPLTRLCILLDAETREFEEVIAFGKPVAYLSREAAIQVVASALRIPPSQVNAEEIPMFKPGQISHVRAYPFWKVVAEEREYYVDQQRKLYSHLSPGKAGS
jgi:hypothetical protein